VADIGCHETAWAEGSDNDMQPICELQIHLVGGEKVALCAGRAAAELRWMAGVLRRALWAAGRGRL
jgi:hypothetical protein